MTIDEFVQTGIHNLMTAAAALAAEQIEDEDECSAVPLAFFQAENRILAAWTKYLDEQSEDDSDDNPPQAAAL
jgi:predicted Na+-dependent transporter